MYIDIKLNFNFKLIFKKWNRNSFWFGFEFNYNNYIHHIMKLL